MGTLDGYFRREPPQSHAAGRPTAGQTGQIVAQWLCSNHDTGTAAWITVVSVRAFRSPAGPVGWGDERGGATGRNIATTSRASQRAEAAREAKDRQSLVCSSLDSLVGLLACSSRPPGLERAGGAFRSTDSTRVDTLRPARDRHLIGPSPAPPALSAKSDLSSRSLTTAFPAQGRQRARGRLSIKG
ncbi:hypothetical protein VTN96DRAFT_1381 [Rasamsonia emersonii]